MKIKLILSTFAIAFLSIILSSYHTGLRTTGYESPDSLSCSSGNSCHPINDNGLACNISLRDMTTDTVLPFVYVPGQTYKLVFQGQYADIDPVNLPSFGFKLDAIAWKAGSTIASHVPGGSIDLSSASVSPIDTYTLANTLILEHRGTLTNPIPPGINTNSYLVSVNWTAPDAITADSVAFYGTICAVQGTGTLDSNRWISATPVKFSSKGLSVNKVAKEGVSVSLYPNPTKGNITIAMNNINAGAYKLFVYNAMGRLMVKQVLHAKTNTVNATLSTDKLMPGIYYVSIQIFDNQLFIPFVKQ